MKSKPLVLDHLRTVHESVVIDFTFQNNITILTGSAGTGKTMVFSFISECEASNPDVICFNYLNTQEEIEDNIFFAERKLIVIDNADVLLTDKIRKHISLDDKNQYLIIGRNPKNFFATKENFYELEKTVINNQTVMKLKPTF
ncbi:MAG: ABC transporter ATP-binding protein [Lachnospiraceae bacterium]|nr:ABC transporter ATP-binding protein [Lachnospiraceae bacterium]